MCLSRGKNEDCTTTDSPRINGVVERALGLVGTAAMAG